MLFQMPVEVLHLLKCGRVALLAVGKCHRLHVFFCQHEAQRAVFTYCQHLMQIIGVVFHRPTPACILTETHVETVIIAFHAQKCRPQAAALDGVLVACFRTEIQQVLFAA